MLNSCFKIVVKVAQGTTTPVFWEAHLYHIPKVLLANNNFSATRRLVLHQVAKKYLSKGA